MHRMVPHLHRALAWDEGGVANNMAKGTYRLPLASNLTPNA